ARFHAEHPGVTVRLRHGGAGSALLAEELQAGQLDVAFVSLERAPAGVELVPLSVEEIVLVCLPEHPLAGPRGSRGAAQRTARSRSAAAPAARPPAPRRISLARAAHETLIDFPPGYGNRMTADRAFAAAGVERTIAYEVAEFDAALQLVRHGLGVAFLPAFVVAGLDDVTAVRLREPLRMRMSAAVSTTLTAAVRAFLATVELVARA
ncbi:MAG TPA: LysR substrate-binding domain-containing protein, partial [Conexibacter sp.]|nr:LysR substrate-binding domain-containing protein [Conexibacter sp.]